MVISTFTDSSTTGPYLDVISKIDDFIFRYLSDRRHGHLPDVCINLKNYDGNPDRRIMFTCTIHTGENLVPSHKLVNHNNGRDIEPVFEIPLGGHCSVKFKGLVIKIIKRREVKEAMRKKLIVDGMLEGKDLENRIKNQVKAMSFHKVRLRFDVFELKDNNWSRICPPKLSNEINDKRIENRQKLATFPKTRRVSKTKVQSVKKAGGCKKLAHQISLPSRSYDQFQVENTFFHNCNTPLPVAISNPIAYEYTVPATMCEQNSKSVYCNVLPVAARAVGSSKHSNWIVSDLIELDPNELSLYDFDCEEDMSEVAMLPSDNNESSLMAELDAIIAGMRTGIDGSSTGGDSINMRITLLLVLFMYKICRGQNTCDNLAYKFKSLFISHCKRGRVDYDTLIKYHTHAFGIFLNCVEKLDLGDMLNVKNHRQRTCFHSICENGTMESIRLYVPLLIRLGSNPNLTDDRGDSALHVLIRANRSAECVKVLLKATHRQNIQLDMNVTNNDNLTPLQLAEKLKRAGVRQLIEKYGDKYHNSKGELGKDITRFLVNGITNLFRNCFPFGAGGGKSSTK